MTSLVETEKDLAEEGQVRRLGDKPCGEEKVLQMRDRSGE